MLIFLAEKALVDQPGSVCIGERDLFQM